MIWARQARAVQEAVGGLSAAGCCDDKTGVAVLDGSHPSTLLRPVRYRILDDAEGADPQVSGSEISGDANGMLEIQGQRFDVDGRQSLGQ